MSKETLANAKKEARTFIKRFDIGYHGGTRNVIAAPYVCDAVKMLAAVTGKQVYVGGGFRGDELRSLCEYILTLKPTADVQFLVLVNALRVINKGLPRRN